MREAWNERLRRRLRRGDPAAGLPALGADEAARLRRIILAAVAEAPQPFWRPWLVPALIAALALLVLALWRVQAPPPERFRQDRPRREARAPTASPLAPPAREPSLSKPPVPAPAAPRAAAEASGERLAAVPPSSSAPTPRPAAARPGAEGASAAQPGSEQAGGGRRQVHFVTAGGTRVIWVLDPEFSLDRGTLPETETRKETI